MSSATDESGSGLDGFTFILPTWQPNHALLNSCLHHLQTHFAGQRVVISEVYPEDQKEELWNLLRRYQDGLSIEVLSHSIDQPFSERLMACTRRVTTELTVLIADDDFVIPRGLHEAVNFLRRHKNYSACLGDIIYITDPSYKIARLRKLHGDRVPIDSVQAATIDRSDQPVSLEDDDAGVRIKHILAAYYHLVYSVCRTDKFGLAMEMVNRYANSNFFSQYLATVSIAALGKVKVVDSLYYVRRRRLGAVSQQDELTERSMPFLLLASNFSDLVGAFFAGIVELARPSSEQELNALKLFTVNFLRKKLNANFAVKIKSPGFRAFTGAQEILSWQDKGYECLSPIYDRIMREEVDGFCKR